MGFEHNKEKLVSKEYNDVYYSDEDGFEEKENVFIKQSNYLNHLEKSKPFQVVEFGFGLGINLANCYRYWRESELAPALNFITIEKYPLPSSEILNYHNQENKLTSPFENFINNYSLFNNGWNKVELEKGFNIHFFKGDINDALLQLPNDINIWFLDGFSPSLNEEMWSENIFKTMATHSLKNTCFATYSAAGFVRRGLQAVGFKVNRNPGWGRKREMLNGFFIG